jgi:shikimate kinase
MGAGKSTVGRALAKRLGWAFEDLDSRIEKREKRQIHKIFSHAGEAEFRRAEHAALKELLTELETGAPMVVALGGGAFVQRQNAALIQKAGAPTIFLDATVDELWARCRQQAEKEALERPLLSNVIGFRELYTSRRRHYLKASIRQETTAKTVDEIVTELVEVLGPKASSSPPETRKTR